jgi:hypothetical protein
MSMERRRRLSAGKGGLGVSPNGAGSAGSGNAASIPGFSTFSGSRPDLLGKRLSMERRRQLSAGKGGLTISPLAGSAGAPASTAANDTGTHGSHSVPLRGRAKREGLLQSVAKASVTPSNPALTPRNTAVTPSFGKHTVTGSRIGKGSEVTGGEAGTSLPVSGTQCISVAAGYAARSGGPKVGYARTPQGGIVSGSLVRSTVRVTGDEAGARTRITGEADQRLEDDLTERAADGGLVAAQFQRQIAPHAQSGFAANLGRNSGRVGSRERERSAPLESTESGLSITGSAVGRTIRVTGDEAGACRQVTGDQYMSPARAQAECGGRGGGTAPAAQVGAMRRDPVSGAKVSVAETAGRQRVTGCNVEHDPRVTGDAVGSSAVLTGTPYHGTGPMSANRDQAAARRAARSATAVTGDTPLLAQYVTGAGRGAALAISGTPYFGETAPAAVADNPVAALEARFSIRSPQRTAQLLAADAAASAPPAERITGSFAVGHDKVTGNLEFRFTPRRAAEADARAAHSRLSGEGSSKGRTITNGSWTEHAAVTGTDGSSSVERNPSERGGKPHTFAGAVRFKSLAKQEEGKQLVTGLFGWSSKTGAKVTLSGGAQG